MLAMVWSGVPVGGIVFKLRFAFLWSSFLPQESSAVQLLFG